MTHRVATVLLVSTAMIFGAGQSTASAQGVANLKDQLANGLRTRLPKQLAFIDEVVELVENGKLPESLVTSTFEWARRKHQKFPFPYFERALRLRAERVGIKIP